MSQKLPLGGLNWIKTNNEAFIKTDAENSETGYVLKVHLKLHNEFYFFTKKMVVHKFEKLICNVNNKKDHGVM